jgi:predicted phosphatase
MWDFCFEFGAIALLRGLATEHFPDYLLLLPHPTEFPARQLNMTILLVVV